MNEIRKEHHQNRLNGKQFKMTKRKNQNSNKKAHEHHKQKYKKKEKEKEKEQEKKKENKSQQQQKQQQQKQKPQQQKQQQQKHKPQKQNQGNMNSKKEQYWNERKSYENDITNIDNEINDLQDAQYNYLNYGFNNNNGQNSYIIQNPTLQGYKPRHGNHINRSHMLSKPGSFVPGYMATDVNDYKRSMPLPFDRGGDELHDNGNQYVRNGSGRRNYQNGNINVFGYNRGMDYSNHANISYGYNPHNRNNNYNNLKSTRFDPIGNNHNRPLDYGLSNNQ